MVRLLTTRQINRKKNTYKWFLKQCEKLQIDFHTVDFEAEFDSNLSISENKQHIQGILNTLSEDLMRQMEYVKSQEEMIKNQEHEANKRMLEEIKQKSVASDCKEIEDFFIPTKRAIDKLTQGYSNLLIIKGRAGIGKSYQIEKYLKQNKAEYREVTKVTEAYLYRILYENNDKIIWFRDFNSILNTIKGIDELKAATDDKEHRIITNYNYSEKQEDIPKEFVFTGRILIDCNSIMPKFREDMEALFSRGDVIDLVFSFNEMKKLLFLLCHKDTAKEEVTKFLIKNYNYVGFNELNLRTQSKAFKTQKFAIANKLNWKEEIKRELKQNQSKVRSMLYSFMGDYPVKTTELKKYLIRSGLVSTIRTADRRINEWIELEEIYKIDTGERNFSVSLNPIDFHDTSDKNKQKEG
ncbi:MAG: hypothetical protein ACTSX6_04680 [Candidatus Heimdallarchaeaceae archaeon]